MEPRDTSRRTILSAALRLWSRLGPISWSREATRWITAWAAPMWGPSAPPSRSRSLQASDDYLERRGTGGYLRKFREYSRRLGAQFLCVSGDADNGTFTVPSWVMSALPVSGIATDIPAPVGFLAVAS